MAARILEVILNAKDNASAVLKTAEGNVTSAASKMGDTLKALGAAAAALAVGKFLKDSVVEAMAAERSIALLTAALKPLGINYENVRDKTEAYLTSLQRTTRFGDDEYRDVLTRMVTITGDYNKSLAMLPTVAGVAVSGQKDLASAGEAVAKAMVGNTREFAKLFPEIKLTGDAAEFLRDKFERLALEDGKTLESRVIQLKNAWKDFKESIGMAIIGTDSAEESVQELTKKVNALTESVNRNKASIGEISDAVGWFADLIGRYVYTASLGYLGIIQTVRAAIGQLIGWSAVALEGMMTPLRAFGVDAGKDLLAGLKQTGLSMQEEARASIGRLHGVEIAAELTLDQAKANLAQARQGAIEEAAAEELILQKEKAAKQAELDKKAADERERLAKEAEKKRQREAEAHGKELLKIAEEIAVNQLILDEGYTEKQAKELVRRRGILKESLGVVVTDAKEGYKKLDEQQLLLAAGFDTTVVPAVKNTVQEVKTLTAEFAQELPGAIQLTEEQYDELVENVRRGQLTSDLENIAKHKQTFLDLAGNIGLMDDKTRVVAESMSKLVESVGKVSLGDPSAWLDVAASLSGILGQIFGGESPEERARKELIRKNNDALRDLIASNGELLKISSPGRVLSGASAAIRELLADPSLQGRPRGGIRPEELLAALTKRGVSVKELDELAASLGQNFRTGPRGEITAGGLQTLLSSIANADTAFPTTVTGALDRITKGVRLGAIGQTDQLRQVLEAVGGQGPNAIMAALSGLNLNTGEGRTAGVGALRDLFTAFARGDIRPENMGDMTGSEFMQALESLIGLLQDETQILATNRDPFGRGYIDPLQPPPGPWPNFPDAFGDLTVTFEDIGQQQVDYLASINTGIGGLLERWTDIDTGRVVQAAPVTITVGEVVVTTAATDAEGTGQAVQAAVLSAIDEALATRYRDQQLATGGLTRTV